MPRTACGRDLRSGHCLRWRRRGLGRPERLQLSDAAHPHGGPGNDPFGAYPSPVYSFTAGVAARTAPPAVTGGVVVTCSSVPALPAGLTFSSNGSITGTPTAAAAAATYKVTGTNTGGASTTSVSLAVAAGPTLDLGLGQNPAVLQIDGTNVFGQDSNGHWVLWNFTTGTLLASPPIALEVGTPPFQVVTPQVTQPDLVYSPAGNAILSLTSGTTQWASASPSDPSREVGPYPLPGPSLGAIAGSNAIFVSGSQLLAEPY